MSINWKQDRVNSISSASGRLVHEGSRAVQVQPDATSKQQIAALVDLLDLHLSGADQLGLVDADRVVLRVPHLASEARGSLGTLVASLAAGAPAVAVLEGSGDDWSPAETGWDVADESEYAGWAGLLSATWELPALVRELVEQVAVPSLRVYPRLSSKGKEWSIRLEGLEVARATAARVELNVGKDGSTGNRSRQRKAWVEATGRADKLVTSSASEAATDVSRFVGEWQRLGIGQADQDEHALESRILRGEALVAVEGRVLGRVQPDHVVNWGSQFPTKWGPGGSARYLDALLTDGTTPWAVEMKVQGSAGVASYYRQAITQAVLCRRFIRHATPLHLWFSDRGLEATACEAVVVVPRIPDVQEKWRGRLQQLAALFDVAFVEVDPAHARRY